MPLVKELPFWWREIDQKWLLWLLEHYQVLLDRNIRFINNVLLFTRSVMSDSLQPHALQHTRLLCPLLSPGVCSDSCPWSWWCYLSISSSAARFSFCLPFPCGSVGKESTYNVGDLGSIPELERSPGEGKGYPLQYSGLENYRGHKESDTTEWLSLHFTFSIMSFHIKMYLYKSYLYKQD